MMAQRTNRDTGVFGGQPHRRRIAAWTNRDPLHPYRVHQTVTREGKALNKRMHK